MATGRSFAEFVKDKCYNGLYQAAEDYVNTNWESMDFYTRNVHRIGSAEIIDATVERVYVRDLPGMRVAFEVGMRLGIDVKEGNYHYDESDQCYPWIRVYCEGDLACGLDDWEIIRVEPYSKKSAPLNSLSDALVPFIPYDQLDKVATEFLKDHYKDALKVTPYGQPPVMVDPLVLADSLGLTVKQQRIREDASVFGQIYFVETEAEMFDANEDKTVLMTIPEKTIVFDPQMYLLRNLGSVNNTIVHECVHWVKHRKVFELEKLYNAEASHISCEVTQFDVKSGGSSDTTVQWYRVRKGAKAMKHKLKISVSKKPQTGGIVTCRNLTVRDRLLKFLFGDKRRVTVLIPGDSVGEIAICETKEGGDGNGQDHVSA